MINKGRINSNIDMKLKNLYKDNIYILNNGEWIMISNEKFSNPVEKKKDKMEEINDEMMDKLKREVIDLEYTTKISVTPLVYDDCRVLIDDGRYRFIQERYFEMIDMENAKAHTSGDLSKPIRFSNDLKHNEHIYIYPKIKPEIPFLKKPFDVFNRLCKDILIKEVVKETGVEKDVVVEILNTYNSYLAKDYWSKHYYHMD